MTTITPDVRELDEDPTPKGMQEETMPTDTGRASKPLSGDDTGYRCETCNTSISTPTGRKPKVMLCAEHKTSNRSGDGGGPKRISRGNHAKIEEGMTAFYGMIGMGLAGVGIATKEPVWMRDSQAFNQFAPGIGTAWANTADNSLRTQKALLKFLDTVGFMSLLGAHIPLVLSVANNHNQAYRQAESEGR